MLIVEFEFVLGHLDVVDLARAGGQAVGVGREHLRRDAAREPLHLAGDIANDGEDLIERCVDRHALGSGYSTHGFTLSARTGRWGRFCEVGRR
jgi:hypothetical protein